MLSHSLPFLWALQLKPKVRPYKVQGDQEIRTLLAYEASEHEVIDPSYDDLQESAKINEQENDELYYSQHQPNGNDLRGHKQPTSEDLFFTYIIVTTLSKF